MEVFNVVIWFTVLGISSAFLMQDIVNKTSPVTNSGHSNPDTTDQRINDVMTFLAEEKRLRYQLEQRLEEAEKKLQLFDQFNDAVTVELQHERDVNKLLEQQLNSTNSSIDAFNAELQHERDNNRRLEQMLNSTNSSLDGVIATNRRLEQMVHNTSSSVNTLTTEVQHERDVNKRLEQQLNSTNSSIGALAAELQHERDTVSQLEQKLNSTTSNIDAVTATNRRLEQMAHNTSNSLNALTAELHQERDNNRRLGQQLNNTNSSISALTTAVQHERDSNRRLEQMVYNTNSSINTLSAEIRLELQQKLNNTNISIGRNDRMIAFSVDTPTTGNPLRFTTSTFNQGGAYNMSTGKLVCNQPGIYFLTFTLVQSGSSSYEYCCVNVNNAKMNHACALTGGGSGSYPSGSRSLIVRLQMNDEVTLQCNRYSFVGDSGFTGFLIQAEN